MPKITLATVTTKIDDLIKYNKIAQSPYTGDLKAAHSKLTEFNARIEKLLKLEEFSPEDNTAGEKLSKLKADYQLIANELKGLGLNLSDLVKKNNEQSKTLEEKQIDEIAQNLIDLGDLVPSITPECLALHHLCLALGGISIKISQANLPTAGGEKNIFNNDLIPTKGICGGLVRTWIDRSLDAGGSPNYPITSTIGVLKAQERLFHPNAKSIFAKKLVELNRNHLFDTLDENSLNEMHIRGDGWAHAIGLRKNQNRFEIFDPNYGYFTLRDRKNASLLLSAIITSYEFDFNAVNSVEIAKCGTQIEANKFPNNSALDKAAISALSKESYKNLKKFYQEQISKILAIKNKENSPRILLDIIRDFGSSLNDTDKKTLVHHLENCRNGQASKLNQALLGEEAIEYIAAFTSQQKGDLSQLFDTIIREASIEIALPKPITQLLEEIDTHKIALVNNLETARADYLSTISKPLPKHKDDILDRQNEINKLTLDRKRLENRLQKLAALNIKEKLIATHLGHLDNAYSLEQAKKDLASLAVNDLPTSNADLALIGKLQDLNHKLLNHIEKLSYISGKALSVEQALSMAKKNQERSHCEDIIKLIEKAENAIYNEENPEPIIIDIQKYIPSFNNPLNLLDDDNFDELTSQFKEVEKYSDAELKIIRDIFRNVDQSSSSIQYQFQSTLNKLKNEDTDEAEFLSARIKDANALQSDIQKVLNPYTTDKIDIKILIQAVRTLSPESIDQNGAAIAKKTHSHLSSFEPTQIPKKVTNYLAQLASLPENKPAEETIKAFIEKNKTSSTFLNDKKITLEDYLNQIKTHFDLPKATPANEITFSIIKEKIDAKILEINNEAEQEAERNRLEAEQRALAEKLRLDEEKRLQKAKIAKQSANILKLKTFIADNTYWHSKVSVFNIKKAPDGVVLMRKVIQNNPKCDDAHLMDLLSNIASDRINKKKKAFSFFESKRHTDTDVFYRAFYNPKACMSLDEKHQALENILSTYTSPAIKQKR